MPVDVTHACSYLDTPVTMLAKKIHHRNTVVVDALGSIAADDRHALVAIVTSRLRSTAIAAVPSTSDAVRCMRHAYPHSASVRWRALQRLMKDSEAPSSNAKLHPAATIMCDLPYACHRTCNAALGDCLWLNVRRCRHEP